MSEFPSLPLFTDAFLADTGHLSAQETGAYMLLLMLAWRSPECSLPDDDGRLAKWARVDLRTWKRIKPVVMEFWTLAGGRWTQKRLSKERDIVSKRVNAARENGRHGGRPKPLERQQPDNPVGSFGLPQPKAPNPNPNPNPKPRPMEGGGGGDARAREDELAAELSTIAGHPADPKDWPAAWCGTPHQIRKWLNEDFSRDEILQGAREAMAHKRDGPPYSANFFDKPITRTAARMRQPVPNVVELPAATVEVGNGQDRNSGLASGSLGYSGIGAQLRAARAARSI